MRIGFDAKRIFSNYTGLGNYSRTLVKNLVHQFPANNYFLFSPVAKPVTGFDTLKNAHTIHPPSAISGSLWRSYGINDDLVSNNIEVYHGLSNEIPVLKSTTHVKCVVTIHDLIFKHFPQHYPFADRTIYNIKSKYACKHADAIIATSAATKNDILKFYNVDEKKVHVVYQSCDELFLNTSSNFLYAELKNKYNLPSEYLLYVGSITERKNLLNVCKAYLTLTPQNRIPLVVIGKGSDYAGKVHRFVAENNLQPWFIFLENITNNELITFYKNAMAFIYPSLYEGFGIPVLEAMACECPVIISNVSSLPEVGGTAASYVDPSDAESIAEKIKMVTQNTSARTEMKQKGVEQAKLFNAKTITQEVMRVYESLIN